MLKINIKAPTFNLNSTNGNFYSLKNSIGKYVILYFYPKDDTPGCTTEACNFRDNIEIINKLNTNILGISVDSNESHKQFSEKYSLPFPILADTGGDVAKLYDSYGSFVGFKYASRNTFIINPSGKIHKIYKKVNASSHAEEVISELKNNI